MTFLSKILRETVVGKMSGMKDMSNLHSEMYKCITGPGREMHWNLSKDDFDYHIYMYMYMHTEFLTGWA